jgi:CBS domain-containing protein
MKIKDIMTKEVKYINPNTTIKEAAHIMRDKDIGSLPVSENDQIIGVITDRDIAIRAIANGSDPQTETVKQIMTPKCLYCFEEDSVEDTAKNMAENQIRRLPVMNKEKRLVGIISLADISIKASKQAAGEALQSISQKSHR